MGGQMLVLTGVAALASVLFLSIPVQATHWCDTVDIRTSPAEARAGESLPFHVQLINQGSETLNVTIQTRFGWEDQAWFWGTMNLAPGERDENVFTKTVTSVTGDYGVRIFLSGTAEGTGEEADFCPFQQRNFRVTAGPEFAVVATAQPTGGQIPLTVGFQADVAGGSGAVEYVWEFGDGASATGPNASHTYETAGTYTAQIVARDAVGRLAVDRVSINVAETAARDGQSIPTAGPLAVISVLLVAAMVSIHRTRE